MFNTIQSRILAVIIVSAAAALISIIFVTKTNFDAEIFNLNSNLASNSIDSAITIIEKEYDELTKFKRNSIIQRRKLMENVSDAVLKTLNTFHRMSELHRLPENEAKEKALQWINEFRYGANHYFFVCDLDLEGLAHPLPEMIGIKWIGYTNLNFQDTFLEIKNKIVETGTIYRVLEWPTIPEGVKRKQMIVFRYVPGWDWILGASIPIDDIEADIRKQEKEIVNELNRIFNAMRHPNGSRFFVFDIDGDVLIPPGTDDKTQRDTEYIVRKSDFLSGVADAGGERLELSFDHHRLGRLKSTQILYGQFHKLSGWSVVLSVSKDNIMIPAKRLVLKQTYIVLLILLISVPALALICLKITKPLSDIEKYARALPEKDPAALGTGADSIFPPARKNLPLEIQSLNDAFIFMERRLAEGIQRRMEDSRFLNIVLENSPIGICKINRKNRLTFLNIAMANLFGRHDHDRSEIEMKNCFDEPTQDRLKAVLRKSDHSVIEDIDRKQMELEGNAIRFDGSVFPVEISANLVEIDFECMLLCLVKDISVRKEEEKRLRETQWNLEREIKARTKDLNTSNAILKHKIIEHFQIEKARWETEERFKSIFEQAAVGIAILNEKGEFLQVNRKLCEMTAYSRREIMENTVQNIVPPEKRKQMLSHYSQMRKDKANEFSMEMSVMSKNQTRIDLNLLISHVKSMDGRIKYFIAVVEDITARKIIEKELIDTKLKAETENKSKSLVLSNLADGVEKPVNEVLLTVEQALADDPDPKTRSRLEKINQSGHSALNVIRRLSSLSIPPAPRNGRRLEKKILLAEDDRIHQNYLHHYLTSAGHHVTVADNGAQALEALKTNRFDVVLMDIQMPEMDGVTATLSIRNDQSGSFDPNIPIIALTAYSMARDRKRFIETGMNAYFSKPIINIDQLLSVIEDGVQRRDQSASSNTDPDTDIEANVKELFELYKNRPARLKDMIDLFMTEVPNRIELLNRSIFEKDRTAGKQAAHKLTNALAFVRTPSLIQALGNVKKSIENSDFENAETAFREIREKIETICEILQNRNRIHTDGR